MRKPRRYYVAPDLPQGPYYLNPNGPGFFSIIVPIARTNEVTNPSFETGTTSWTASGASIARSATYSYHGAYSLAITPTATLTDGVYYGTVSMTAGEVRAVSCKWKGAAGVGYKLSVATTGGVDLASYRFVATGRWQWVWVYWKETSTTTRRIYFTKDSNASTSPFYIDGVQSEVINAGELVSTYIDGDQAGLLPNQFPYPYRWNGTPHASTSTRDITTRAGGYVMNLDKFRFKLMGIAGLGITLVANIASVGAGTDGSAFQATVANSRQIALRGRLEGATTAHLDRLRSDLYNIVGPDSATPRQPLVLHYQAFDGEREAGDFGRIVASYQSGLEQNTVGLPAEDATITFTNYLPAVFTNETGVALTVQSSVTNANGIIQRSATGVWSALGTGVNANSVTALAYGLDGKLYAGGDFTLMGGVANTVRIAYWDGTAWSAMGTGASSNTVLTILVTPDGTVYAGGTFASMGGVANTAGIAKWNGSAWSAVGTGVTAGTVDVRSLVYGTDGSVYVTGYFTTMGGVANTSRIAKWNGSAWSALSTGLDTGGEALTVGLDGSIYVTGAFATAGGVSATRIARWDGSAFSALSTGLNALSHALSTGPDGTIYVAGEFTTAGGIAANRIAKWNGTAFSALDAGADNSVYAILFAQPQGLFYAGGIYSSIGTIIPPDHIATWNGSAWTLIDADLPGSTGVFAIASNPVGVLTLGFSTTGTATTGAVTTATNDSTARTYPTVTIKGPSSGTSLLYQLRNVTTGKVIFFDYTISSGETLTLITSPTTPRLISSARGDITGAILPGSSPDFALIKGANSISLFAASSTVTALMHWTNAFQSTSDLTQ